MKSPFCNFSTFGLLLLFYCVWKKENWKFLHNEKKKREVAVLPKWCCIISKLCFFYGLENNETLAFASSSLFCFFLFYETFRNIIFLFCWERPLRWESFFWMFYFWNSLLKRGLLVSFEKVFAESGFWRNFFYFFSSAFCELFVANWRNLKLWDYVWYCEDGLRHLGHVGGLWALKR